MKEEPEDEDRSPACTLGGLNVLKRRRPSLMNKAVLAILAPEGEKMVKRERSSSCGLLPVPGQKFEGGFEQDDDSKPKRRMPKKARTSKASRSNKVAKAEQEQVSADPDLSRAAEQQLVAVQASKPATLKRSSDHHVGVESAAQRSCNSVKAACRGDDSALLSKTPDLRPAPKRLRFSPIDMGAAGDGLAGGECGSAGSGPEPEPELSASQPVATPQCAVPLQNDAPCFAWTGIELSEKQKVALRDLGCTLESEWSPQVSHLIADTFRRTTKMMCAICHGAQIVMPEYIMKCREAKTVLDAAQYALSDRVCEAAFARKRGLDGYCLADALERRKKNGPLLQGISVHCLPSVVERRELPLLIAAAGGKWVNRFPLESHVEGLPGLLLLGERTVCTDKELQRRKAHKVYDVELIREAACTQVLRKGAYRLR